MKRNYIDEITQIKRRNGDSREILFRLRLHQLKQQFDNLISTKDEKIDKFEMSKYFPIALVATAELFFRRITQLLIDKGEPYTSNAKKFNQTQNIKFDFEIVNAIHGKLVTIGEVISHVLSFNNLKDINSNLSTILGKDLIKELKTFNKKTTVVDDFNEAVDNFQIHHKIILSDINRLYELRHIFSHEFGTSEVTTIDEIYRIFCNSIIFYVLCEWYLENELYPDSPETTFEMIERAKEIYEASQKVLDKVIGKIKKKCSSSEKDRFEDFLKKWDEYRDYVANYQSEFYEFGTIKPLVYLTEKTDLTEEFAKRLKSHPYYTEDNK